MPSQVTSQILDSIGILCRTVFSSKPGIESKITGAVSAMCSKDRFPMDESIKVDEEFCRLLDVLGKYLDQEVVGNCGQKGYNLWSVLKLSDEVEKGCKVLAYLIEEKKAESDSRTLCLNTTTKSILRSGNLTESKRVFSTPVPHHESDGKSWAISTIADATSLNPAFKSHLVNVDKTKSSAAGSHRLPAGQSMATSGSFFNSGRGANGVEFRDFNGRQHEPKFTFGSDRFSGDGIESQTLVRCESSYNSAIVNFCCGFESSLLKFDPRTGQLQIAKKDGVGRSVQSLFIRLGTTGKKHQFIRQFVDEVLGKNVPQTRKAFAFAVHKYLEEFYSFVRLADSPNTPEDPDSMKLKRLTYWFEAYGDKLSVLEVAVKACGNLQGGHLLSKLYSFYQLDDPGPRKLFYHLLTRICGPIYNMIWLWISDGKLTDFHDEFFIGEDASVSCENTALIDEWWCRKYFVRKEMVPVFLSEEVAKKILVVGKNVIFAARMSKHHEQIPGIIPVLEKFQREVKPESLFLEGSGGMNCRNSDRYIAAKSGDFLEAIVLELSQISSSFVYHELILKEFGLLAELAVLRDFVLLGSGEFAHLLMTRVEGILSQPASEVKMKKSLRNQVELAIKELYGGTTSSEQGNENITMILERLDPDVLPDNGAENGWDVFVLGYKVCGPLGAIILSEDLPYYSQLFRYLWKMQRTRHVTEKLLNELTSVKLLLPNIPEMTSLVREMMALVSGMMCMCRELYVYLSFEVIQCEWNVFIEKIKAADSIDAVATAHREFIGAVFSRYFLKDVTRGVFPKLRLLQSLVLQVDPIIKEFLSFATRENERRLGATKKPDLPPKKAGLLVTGPKPSSRRAIERPKPKTPLKLTDQEKRARLEFKSARIDPTATKIDSFRNRFLTSMCEFLVELSNNSDLDSSLLPLSLRLDFNEFYFNLDKRVGTPLLYRNHVERASATPRRLEAALVEARLANLF